MRAHTNFSPRGGSSLARSQNPARGMDFAGRVVSRTLNQELEREVVKCTCKVQSFGRSIWRWSFRKIWPIFWRHRPRAFFPANVSSIMINYPARLFHLGFDSIQHLGPCLFSWARFVLKSRSDWSFTSALFSALIQGPVFWDKWAPPTSPGKYFLKRSSKDNTCTKSTKYFLASLKISFDFFTSET